MTAETPAGELSLKIVGEIDKITLEPGDVLVASFPGVLSEMQYCHLRDRVNEVFPGYQLLVLMDGLTLEVARMVPTTPSHRASLEPCPFCRRPLTRKEGFNPIARCNTPKCWMSDRMIAVAVDDPEQVRAWNDRGRADLRARD